MRKKNMDIDTEPLRVSLFGHAINGGLVIDPHGRTSVPGLLSAGENAAGPYGADRLGGNMLLNCQVFGKRAGRMAAEIGRSRSRRGFERAAGAATEELHLRAAQTGRGSVKEAQRAVKAAMTDNVLVVRNEEGLRTADRALDEMRQGLTTGEYGVATTKELFDFYEAINLVDVGRAMCAAALLRKETRGSHFREDATGKDPEMARPIMITRGPDGAPRAAFGEFGPHA
jgi:succinate dehydrogenase/fumarate reductase flavoprotein subunit